MTLLAAERIKLLSTRSSYWCLAIILAIALLFALLMGLGPATDGHQAASTASSQVGLLMGMMVIMVLAALAMTTEYRFGTIRTSFLAAPKRANVLLAKTTLLVIVAAVSAAVAGLGAFFLTKALATSPRQPVDLATGADWRVVLGNAALFAIAAVIAVAIGTLIRHPAGAIALLLMWALLLEDLVTLIPEVGIHVSAWLPFHAGAAFTAVPSFRGGPLAPAAGLRSGGPTPLQGLLVFSGTAVALWLIALVVLQRRDA